jgi:hypothetical protein
LVGLDREDRDFPREWLVITLPRSKKDQEGKELRGGDSGTCGGLTKFSAIALAYGGSAIA